MATILFRQKLRVSLAPCAILSASIKVTKPDDALQISDSSPMDKNLRCSHNKIEKDGEQHFPRALREISRHPLHQGLPERGGQQPPTDQRRKHQKERNEGEHEVKLTFAPLGPRTRPPTVLPIRD